MIAFHTVCRPQTRMDVVSITVTKSEESFIYLCVFEYDIQIELFLCY